MAGIVNIDIGSVLSGIGSMAKDVRQAITGVDPTSAQKLLELEQAAQKAQSDINLAEAANPNIFVSGWRPFIGWLCGLSLAIQYIYIPLFSPTLKYDFGDLVNLVIAMLGLGALRTYEKTQGVSK